MAHFNHHYYFPKLLHCHYAIPTNEGMHYYIVRSSPKDLSCYQPISIRYVSKLKISYYLNSCLLLKSSYYIHSTSKNEWPVNLYHRNVILNTFSYFNGPFSFINI
ncbi:104aa long hypothetical protein [Pyrococcus horikoshii OT3]|uniref:Uncharacterized protein n=1 Tax=Pyrococcus horikoshii (strain ATCC 700860 / DSM 12428 / JCM 9974 / NBRC 100139 / OT-3) TaxID=70601 RepID=O58463_PYRHO|nr:104aa long hypothetical protein [Pyrococcus horikoshii OT3]